MGEAGEERRLTTILAADVVGYSGLMAADESGTLARLKTHRKEVIEPKTAEYRGRVVKLMGDGTLMEFGSVVDAIRFAVDVQRAMALRNTDVPEEQRITFRIGINIGDIIVEGEDIYGDGVNIAARLEGLADPGGICVARNVYDQVEPKVDLTFEDLGEREVKNIPRPVQVFKVLLDSPATNHPAVAAAKAKRSLRWPLVAGGLALLVIVAGVALWQRPWAPREEPASEANMAFPLPDKPSIAVLPFNNLSDDASQEYFADGMTEDLITDLSKLSGLFVIARNSVFTYKGKAVKVRQVAEELGVRYVLEGSVRRVGDQVRINAQLVDATTGGHLWAERYDGSLADVFALQDRVTANIIKALAVTLTPEERQDVASFGTTNIAAHDAFLQGQSFYLRDMPEDNAKAEAYFQRAVELDPDFARASAALAKIYLKTYWKDWEDPLQLYWRDAYRLMFQNLERAAGKRIPGVHIVRARLAIKKRQLDVAVMEAKRALELSPNDVEALETLSEALIFAGKPAEGRNLAEQAMRFNPTLPARALYLVGLSHFAEGNFQEAAAHIERALRHAPTVSENAGVLAAAYGKLGLEEKAMGAYETYSKAWQDIRPSVELATAELPFTDALILEFLADGFEKAGAGHGHSHDIGPSRYLPLHSGTKLDGKEIKSLLFDRAIKGFTYPYDLKRPWSQVRTEGGKVTHTGFPIIVYGANQKHGTSWIEDDRLCDRWPDVSEHFSRCALIYRNPGGTGARRNEYIMVTDYGPQPFSPCLSRTLSPAVSHDFLGRFCIGFAYVP